VLTIKDSLVAELLHFDGEFSAALHCKRNTGQGNEKLQDWTSRVKRHGRLVFFLPDLDEDELERATFFAFAYVMPNLPIFSRGSFLADEFDGEIGESIANWLATHFTAQLGVEIKHKFGRFMVGKRDRLPIRCYGISFQTPDKTDDVSAIDEKIEELWKLNTATAGME
jgi:hypothetical protein